MQWKAQVGLPRRRRCRIFCRLAPSITGVWENYKYFLERGANLAAWHRVMPSYYTPDDHEILNDVYGTAEVGRRDRRTVFRDIGMQAWFDYLAGSQPVPFTSADSLRRGEADGRFGCALVATDADFTKLDLKQISNLHVHWGGQYAGVDAGRFPVGDGDPNAGVYELVEVLDRNRLAHSSRCDSRRGTSVYSLGRMSFSSFRVGQRRVLPPGHALHARSAGYEESEQAGHIAARPKAARVADEVDEGKRRRLLLHCLLGECHDPARGTAGRRLHREQGRRLDCVSRRARADDPLLGFARQAGDDHDRRSAQQLGREDHGSRVGVRFRTARDRRIIRRAAKAGGPPNGEFDSRGRKVDIRWSSYIRDDMPAQLRKLPYYAVARVNNVFNNPVEPGKPRWVAFPRPHVVIQYYDGLTGDLLYAEPVHGSGR